MIIVTYRSLILVTHKSVNVIDNGEAERPLLRKNTIEQCENSQCPSAQMRPCGMSSSPEMIKVALQCQTDNE